MLRMMEGGRLAGSVPVDA